MVNLYFIGGILAPREVDSGCGIRVIKCTGEHDASVSAWFDGDAGEVSAKNIVTGIAPVVVYIGPGLAELIAGVPSFRCASFNLEGF